jgi:hypothetical protein
MFSSIWYGKKMREFLAEKLKVKTTYPFYNPEIFTYVESG